MLIKKYTIQCYLIESIEADYLYAMIRYKIKAIKQL